MCEHLIAVDVYDSIKDLYPGLGNDTQLKIAKHIKDNWDYSNIYDTIIEEIEYYSERNGIDLEGKDGVVIEDERPNLYIIDSPPKSELFP